MEGLAELFHAAVESRRSSDELMRVILAGALPLAGADVAVVCGPDGSIFSSAVSEGVDSEAARLLATEACRSLKADVLADATIYSSAETWAMCAGAIYWAGIGRLVYGLSEARLRDITGNHPENPTLDLPCRAVFASGQRKIDVVGPLLEDEAAAPHAGAWKK